MVRGLSKHQSAFLFDCCVFIARFASLSCYSSAKTRIRPVKSYQINESFCSITHCALLHIVYRFIVVLTRFRCPELQVRLLSLPLYSFFELEPEPEPAFESHFRFSIAFSHRVSVRDITVLTLRTCNCVQVPFKFCEFYQLLNKTAQPYYSPSAAS